MGRNKGASPSLRQLRVGEELRHAVVRVLEKSRFDDPALSASMITVTEVKISPDLKSATVFVIPLGGQDLKVTVEALNRASGYLRGQLGRELTLRHTPRLGFAADNSFDYAVRVQELLSRPKVRADLTAAEGTAPAEGDDETP